MTLRTFIAIALSVGSLAVAQTFPPSSGGGSVTVPGTSGAVLFNNAGALGGTSAFAWDGADKLLSIGAGITAGNQDCANYVGNSNICITSDNSTGNPFNALGIQATGSDSSSSQGIYILSTSGNPDGLEIDTVRADDLGNNVQTGYIYTPGASGTTVPGTGGVRAIHYATYQNFDFGTVQEFIGDDDTHSLSVCVFCSALNDAAGKTRWAFYGAGDAKSYFGGGIVTPLHTPASSSEACTAGQFSDDANFHYVCVSSGVWKRVALSSF